MLRVGVPQEEEEAGAGLLHRQGHSATQCLPVTCEGTAGAEPKQPAVGLLLTPGNRREGVPR